MGKVYDFRVHMQQVYAELKELKAYLGMLDRMAETNKKLDVDPHELVEAVDRYEEVRKKYEQMERWHMLFLERGGV
jgi:hypothetical protein